MPVLPLAASSFIAYHGTHAGRDGGNIVLLVVFLGVLATAAWLIFSEMRWLHTVSLAVAGWVAGLSVVLVF